MPEKTRVIVTRKLPELVETQLSHLFDVKFNNDDKPFSKSQICNSVSSADVLICTVTDQIDRDVVDAAGEQFRLFANFGVGVNHIDLEAAETKGIQVSNTPDVLTEDTADLGMALILMSTRRLGEGERLVRVGDWKGWAPTQLLGQSLTKKSIGIIGMGRIGQALARRARCFGMIIHYHNRKPCDHKLETDLEAIYWEDLDEMLPNVDVISLNTPYTVSTENILDAKRLNLLKPGSILINTARGGLVDENVLISLLNEGRIAAAGLDVYENEPNLNPNLVDAENIVLLPHLGSATVETRVAMGRRVIKNIQSLVDGAQVPDRINVK